MKRDFASWIIWGLAAIGCTTIVSSAPSSPVHTTRKNPNGTNLHDCDCFTVSGPDPGYFQHYKLWDFRSVPLNKHSHTYPLDPGDPPGNVGDDWDDDDDADYDDDTDGDEDGDENEDEDGDKDEDEDKDDQDTQASPDALFFFRTAFDKDWISQQWQRPQTPIAPIPMVNSKRNVFFTRAHDHQDSGVTHLIMRTTRLWNYTSTAEIETRVHDIYRCSLRVRLRIMPADVFIAQPPQDPSQHPLPAPANVSRPTNRTASQIDDRPPAGACVGIFSYHSISCESDIEILTTDPPNRVHYANQPDYDPVKDEMIPGASSTIDVPVPWTSWSTHRLDWHADQSRWYVNNVEQDAKAYRVPNLQSRLVINLWSDGGVWTGDIALGESIYVGIEYIELAYNRSSDGSGGMAVPPSQRHGGHQVFLQNTSTTDVDSQRDAFFPATEIVTGAGKKKKKCKKGRKGRKCRKKHRKGRKGGKGGKGGKDREKGDGWCHRPCNIDALSFAGFHH